MNPSKELVCKENGKIFRLYTNGIKFDKIKLDDGQNNECKKCDYLIVKSTNDIQIFIELKGKKIQDAYDQITESYARYANTNEGIKHYAIIVTSHIPPNERTKLQNVKLKLKKQNLEPYIKNDIIETRYNPNKNIIEKIN